MNKQQQSQIDIQKEYHGRHDLEARVNHQPTSLEKLLSKMKPERHTEVNKNDER